MTATIDRSERVRNKIAVRRMLRDRKGIRPSSDYRPHTGGQEQFHASVHNIRALFPGNGWGKTIALGCEIDHWCRHTSRWQPTPPWPLICLWFGKSQDQLDLQRQSLARHCFGPLVRYKESDDRFVWEDGSFLQMGLASTASDWQRWQGIAADLIAFDEQPTLGLYREMQMRRRGERDTRYILAATATEGITWMYAEIAKPWLEFHQGLGLDEDAAMREQRHPSIFCWTKGGIDDNPGATEEQRRHYHSRTWSSEKERKVRLFGGFESWVGDPVFDEKAVEGFRADLDGLDEKHGRPRRGFFQAVFPLQASKAGA